MTVIKPEYVASSNNIEHVLNNIEHVLKFVMFNKCSLGAEHVYVQSICLCFI